MPSWAVTRTVITFAPTFRSMGELLVEVATVAPFTVIVAFVWLATGLKVMDVVLLGVVAV